MPERIRPTQEARDSEPAVTTVDFVVGPFCRSCPTQVIWAETDKGKPMLVDAEPTAGANVQLTARPDGRAPLARVVKPDLTFGRTNLRLAHFATCPQAASHRRKRGRS